MSTRLLLEIDRGDYLQQVTVRVPAGPFEEISLGRQLSLGGWLRVGRMGHTRYTLLPDRVSDRDGGGTSGRISRTVLGGTCVRQVLVGFPTPSSDGSHGFRLL